jgi:hypothetical protein
MKVRHALSLLCSIAIVALTASATAQAPNPMDNNPDVLEVRHYRLTLEQAEKTATAMQAVNQLVAANRSLSAAMDASSSSTSKKPLTQQAQDIDAKFPQVAGVIHANGLATREFIVLTGAIINDIGWVGMKKQGMISAYPPGMVTPENATLIEQNWDKFQAIGAKMTPPNTK